MILFYIVGWIFLSICCFMAAVELLAWIVSLFMRDEG